MKRNLRKKIALFVNLGFAIPAVKAMEMQHYDGAQKIQNTRATAQVIPQGLHKGALSEIPYDTVKKILTAKDKYGSVYSFMPLICQVPSSTKAFILETYDTDDKTMLKNLTDFAQQPEEIKHTLRLFMRKHPGYALGSLIEPLFRTVSTYKIFINFLKLVSRFDSRAIITYLKAPPEVRALLMLPFQGGRNGDSAKLLNKVLQSIDGLYPLDHPNEQITPLHIQSIIRCYQPLLETASSKDANLPKQYTLDALKQHVKVFLPQLVDKANGVERLRNNLEQFLNLKAKLNGKIRLLFSEEEVETMFRYVKDEILKDTYNFYFQAKEHPGAMLIPSSFFPE